MKKYSQEQALASIFDTPKKPLSDKLLVYKHRYKSGTLSQKSIDAILAQFGFIVHRPVIYIKKKKEKKKRFPHIQKSRFININIDIKTYNRVVRVMTVGDGGTSDIEINKWFLKRLEQDNEFVRLKCLEYYIDVKIHSFKEIDKKIKSDTGTRITRVIIVSLGDIIDSNNLSRIIQKDHDNSHVRYRRIRPDALDGGEQDRGAAKNNRKHFILYTT